MAAKTKLACFSFAAYAKTLIDHLKSLNIPVLPGLSDSEFKSIESTFKFTFPPDLRSILQEGLPIGPHFPNWRSSSTQQLQILLNLPILNLSKNISQNHFWVDSWGDYKPEIAKTFLERAPVLVPIYGNCYIPCRPNEAGNPVFCVDDGGVRVLSFDLARFFQEIEFLQIGSHFIRPVNFPRIEKVSINVPAWAATTARKIDFWTEAAERGKKVVARVDTHGWWSGRDMDCLEEVFWKLRDGGWREEEVREMMMMDGCDQKVEEKEKASSGGCESKLGKEDVVWHVRLMSVVLLRAGWSKEDVMYSLDLQDQEDSNSISKYFLDFQVPNSTCSRQDDDHNQKSSIKQLMNLRSLEV